MVVRRARENEDAESEFRCIRDPHPQAQHPRECTNPSTRRARRPDNCPAGPAASSRRTPVIWNPAHQPPLYMPGPLHRPPKWRALVKATRADRKPHLCYCAIVLGEYGGAYHSCQGSWGLSNWHCFPCASLFHQMQCNVQRDHVLFLPTQVPWQLLTHCIAAYQYRLSTLEAPTTSA